MTLYFNALVRSRLALARLVRASVVPDVFFRSRARSLPSAPSLVLGPSARRRARAFARETFARDADARVLVPRAPDRPRLAASRCTARSRRTNEAP